MIPLMKNAFLNEQDTKEALCKFILKSKQLSMGQECVKFEKEFATQQRRKHAVLFNSGGSANLALIQSLKNLDRIKDNENVGFSALTWSTNVMPIIQMNLKPVPVDCSSATLNVMSINLLETLKKQNLSALFITNALGFMGDMLEIKKICIENNIILIEDNCESLGSELSGIKSGNFGMASTFSFFVAHHMSTIEGGMVCTDDPDLAGMLRMVRANGWDRNLSSSEQKEWRDKFNINSEFIAKYTFYDLGFNLRPTEITGFLGTYQLQFLEENINRREANYFQMEQKLKQNKDFIILDHSHINRLSTFAFPFICKTSELRDKYIKIFQESKIEIRPMIAGNMQKQPFYEKYVALNVDLPETDFIHKNGFYCGNYPELSGDDLLTIEQCLS